MIEYWWGCDDGDMRLWGPWHVWIRRIWAGCIASTSRLCKCAPVLQGDGDMRLLGAVACVDMAHMGRLHCQYQWTVRMRTCVAR